jgi:hypothetical protein
VIYNSIGHHLYVYSYFVHFLTLIEEAMAFLTRRERQFLQAVSKLSVLVHRIFKLNFDLD